MISITFFERWRDLRWECCKGEVEGRTLENFVLRLYAELVGLDMERQKEK